MKIKIEYDGRVIITPHSVTLGEHSIEEIVHQALRLEDDKYKVINAEVEIFINCKPDAPRVWIEEEDDECWQQRTTTSIKSISA